MVECGDEKEVKETAFCEGWIGVDLDGTLAHYDGWRGNHHIGKPIPLMVERVKTWLAGGLKVKIFTARAYCKEPDEIVLKPIREWCKEHLGQELPITNVKNFGMIELWDDRCVQVEPNTGKILSKRTDIIPDYFKKVGRSDYPERVYQRPANDNDNGFCRTD